MNNIKTVLTMKTEDFKNKKLEKVEFKNTMLLNCDFSGGELVNVEFTNCIIQNCKFDRAKLTGLLLEECSILNSSFKATMLGTKFIGCEMKEVHFSHCLINTHFFSCNIEDSAFKNLNMTNCIFKDSRIKKVDFTHASLQKVAGLEHTVLIETGDSGANVEVLYILPTNTVYLSANEECVSMPLGELEDYINEWERPNSDEVSYVINPNRLRFIEKYLKLVSQNDI